MLDRSNVSSFGSVPSSGGILPEMLLFCNNLHTDSQKFQLSKGQAINTKNKLWPRNSYACLRLVRFPMAPDKVPERDWLGAPLQKSQERNWSGQFLNDIKVNRTKKRKKNTTTHKPMTRFSGEQVIMAQLQGSTESSSQLFNTPCGSLRPTLMFINASTTTKEKKNPD